MVTHERIKRLRKVTRAEIFAWLRTLPLNLDVIVNGKKFKLVHGAPLEMYPEFDERGRGETYFAVWKRLKAENPMPAGMTVIFGHTPTEEYAPEKPMSIFYHGSMIGIDCGSGYPQEEGGRLACLRLDDMREFYSEM